MSQLCKLSQLCYNFLSHFENKNNLFLISLAIPRPLWSGIHWPIIFFQKKLRFCIFSTTTKKYKTEEKKRVPGPFSSLQFCIFFCCWKYTELLIFLKKMIGQWIPDCDGRGIVRNIKKIFSFSKHDKKWKYIFF